MLAGYAALDAASVSGVLGAYQEMGAFRRPGEQHRAEELRGALRIREKFRRLHEALLDLLADAGYLTYEDGCFTATAAAAVGRAGEWEAALERAAADCPDIAPTASLNREFLRVYPRLLRAELVGTQVMFPDSSMELVRDLYRGNPLTDFFNSLVADAVGRHLAARLPQLAERETFEVLELGAGTGATTERVLPVLAGHTDRVGYAFTDISPRFLDHGRERFAAQHPGVRFQLLNLERDPAEQRIARESADAVVATNVVHATRNLRDTLRAIRSLLKPGGLLVLNELTAIRPYLTVGGGVMEGWWAFEDGELRIGGSPLATPDRWARLLEEEGFTQVAALGADEADLGQRVLVARSAHPVTGPSAAVPQAAPAAETPAAGPVPAEGVQARLRDLLERILKLDEPIDPDRSLADYGFDSLSGLRIVSAVDEEFGVAVPLDEFFERPTLRELTVHLTSEWLTGTAEPATAAPATAAPATAEPLAAGPEAAAPTAAEPRAAAEPPTAAVPAVSAAPVRAPAEVSAPVPAAARRPSTRRLLPVRHPLLRLLLVRPSPVRRRPRRRPRASCGPAVPERGRPTRCPRASAPCG
ncbi:methyltransferase [Streptomyces sp. GKU 257-1]|nr:methyltransferase [Streptomyces sp. GKU 257-1]